MQPSSSWSFLIDENMSVTLVDALRAAGHAAEHVYDAGLQGQLDTAIFAYAQRQQQTIITNDLDFSNIREYPPPHAGIVVARLPNEMPLADRINEMMGALATLAGQKLNNTLVIVEPGRVRVRRAP
jgi:predicted nuclease of predicted toxin-antitoxin system